MGKAKLVNNDKGRPNGCTIGRRNRLFVIYGPDQSERTFSSLQEALAYFQFLRGCSTKDAAQHDATEVHQCR